MDGKGVVLEGVELGNDAQPGSLGESRQHGGQAGQPREAREGRDADHRRDQHQPVGRAQLGVIKRIQRVHQRQRAAVRKPHQVQRQGRGHPAAGFAHGKPRGRRPVFPMGLRQAAGHRAMARHPDGDGHVAHGLVMRGDVPQAVRRIGEPVQQHGHAHGLAGRQQHERPVPVMREMLWIHFRARKIPVAVHLVFRLQRVAHVLPHQRKELFLVREVILPGAPVQPIRIHVLRHIGVPGRQRRALLDVVEPDTHQGAGDQHHAHGQNHGRLLQTPPRHAGRGSGRLFSVHCAPPSPAAGKTSVTATTSCSSPPPSAT
ncbi:hypothetical protein D3C85_129550 [compost metagenome]